MPALDGMAGIVFGAVFGSIFVLTCIISAIKAVRDRSRIKKRRAQKKRERFENGYANDKKHADVEQIQPVSTYTQCQTPISGDGTLNTENSGRRTSMEHLDLSIYSIDTGVDNLTFKHSNSDIKHSDGIRRVSSRNSQTPAEIVPLSKCTNLHNASAHPEKNLKHLSSDCLAIQKSIRRNSYEIAICENSWLPMEPPSFAKSQTILNTYNYGGNPQIVINSPKVSFENKAYDKHDCRNNYDCL